MFEYPYQRFVAEKISLVAKRRVVLDVGGGPRFSKWLKPFEPLFKDTEYKSMDYDGLTGADVIGDIHAIPLPDASVDAIICSSVFEHIRDPLRAMDELRRILRQGGVIFFYAPSIYPYHVHPGPSAYPDYWRFFGDTVKLLFEGYTKVEVQKRGGYFLALSNFVPGQHRIRRLLDISAYLLDRLFETEKRSTTAGYYVYAEK